jgi:hypothetical protein
MRRVAARVWRVGGRDAQERPKINSNTTGTLWGSGVGETGCEYTLRQSLQRVCSVVTVPVTAFCDHLRQLRRVLSFRPG